MVSPIAGTIYARTRHEVDRRKFLDNNNILSSTARNKLPIKKIEMMLTKNKEKLYILLQTQIEKV